jgi:hypothetical protein
MNDIETRLKQLAPEAGTLGRDALLYSAAYAAGRSAGRTPWRRASGVLALALVATSLAWAFTPRMPALPGHAAIPAEPVAPVQQALPEPYPPEPTSYIALMRNMGEPSPPPSAGTATDTVPPLTPRSTFE